jgi:hypothetical protein
MRSVIILVATALIATGAAADPKDQKNAKKDDSQKIICKSEEFVGSMIPRRICMTKAKWDEGEFDAQRALDQKRLGVDPKMIAGPSVGG